MKIIFGVAIAAICVISVVTTIGTFGLGIPLLAGIGLLSDGCMAAMAVSDIDEGFQDAIYGKYGANIETHNYICDHVFAGNKTAYMITELALGGLSWAGAKTLSAYAGEKIAAEALDNTFDDSFNIVDRSIDETVADSENMLEESGSRLALPEPEKLLELPAPEERLALPPPVNKNPWLDGSEIKSIAAPENFKIKMAMAREQIKPGGWGTLDTIKNVKYAREELAITPEFKPVITKVQEYLVPEGTRIQIGTAGPQVYNEILYPGGGNQVEILNYIDRNKLIPIGDPYNII